MPLQVAVSVLPALTLAGDADRVADGTPALICTDKAVGDAESTLMVMLFARSL